MNTLEIAAIGLRQDIDRLKLTSQNVANISTPGYKRQMAVQRPFAETLALAADLSVTTDTRTGKVNSTGQALDVALPDGRYLLLELADGSQALTRQGALQLEGGMPGATAETSEPTTLNLEALEKQAIQKAIAQHHGNLSKAAQSLGLGRTTLYRKMTRYGL